MLAQFRSLVGDSASIRAGVAFEQPSSLLYPKRQKAPLALFESPLKRGLSRPPVVTPQIHSLVGSLPLGSYVLKHMLHPFAPLLRVSKAEMSFWFGSINDLNRWVSKCWRRSPDQHSVSERTRSRSPRALSASRSRSWKSRPGTSCPGGAFGFSPQLLVFLGLLVIYLRY